MTRDDQQPPQTLQTQQSGASAEDAAAADGRDWGFGRPLFKNPWFYFALVLMAVVTVSRPYLRHVAPPPPVIRDLPAYTYISESDVAFGSGNLAGRPYVLSFFFSRCGTVCPLIMQRMADLQKQVRDSGLPLRLVSLTVDPAHDRPDVLRDYGQRMGAQADSWTFLTAPSSLSAEDYARQIEETFGVAAGVATQDSGAPVSTGSEGALSSLDLAHAERLMLIDQKGRLRGLYPATPEGIDEIFHRAVSLMGEPQS